MAKRESVGSRYRVKALTDEDIQSAKESLRQVDWGEKKRRSETARIFEGLRSEIEHARQIGVSWPVIAETINERLGTKIHSATMRAYFNPSRHEKDDTNANV